MKEPRLQYSRRVLLRDALFAGILCIPSARVNAQQDTTFSVGVNVVNIFASVRDKHGQIVNNLTQDDFVLSDEGHPVTIRYFSRETDLPLTLGLLVDTSLSQRRVLGEEKDASYRFLDEMLRPEKDRTFVIHFDHDSELLQDLTSSRTDLRKALDELELPADARPQLNRRGSGGQGGSYPGGGYPGGGYPGGGYPGGSSTGRQGRQAGTTLYDAIFLASNDITKKQQGRKALILLTDGVDEGSKTSIFEAIRAAQQSDTLVYSILFADTESYGQHSPLSIGMGGPRGGMGRGGGGTGRTGPGSGNGGQRPDGKKILEQISRETGGGFFEVSKKESIDDIYRKIQEELRNQYSIGYAPDQSDAATGFRRIILTTKKIGLTVQAPEGYYPAGKQNH